MRRLAVFLVLVGCGEHGSTPPDVPIPPPPPPPHGPVSVHVSQDGGGVAGVRVVFTDLFDSLAGDTTTDVGGFASQDIQTSATITVIDPFGPPANGTHDIRSYRAVSIGQTLEITQTTAAPPTNKVTVTAPLDPGAVGYTLETTCGSFPLVKGTTQAKATITLHCNTADLLLETRDGSAQLLHSIFVPSSPIVDGATIALPDAYAAPTTTLLDLQVPFAGGTVMGTATLHSAGGAIATQSIQVDETTGFGQAAVPTPAIAASIVFDIAVPAQQGELAQQHALASGQIGNEQGIFLDNTQLLPHIIAAPDFTAPNNVFWTERTDTFLVPEQAIDASPPPMLSADFVIAKLSITRATATWSWTVAVPHSGGFAALPTLPIDLADLVPMSTDAVTVDKLVEGRGEGYFAIVPHIDALQTAGDLIAETSGFLAFFQELDRNAGLAARAR
jgi:hypothetical protein